MAMAMGTQRFCPCCGAILTWKGEVRTSMAVDFLDWQETAKAKADCIRELAVYYRPLEMAAGASELMDDLSPGDWIVKACKEADK